MLMLAGRATIPAQVLAHVPKVAEPILMALALRRVSEVKQKVSTARLS